MHESDRGDKGDLSHRLTPPVMDLLCRIALLSYDDAETVGMVLGNFWRTYGEQGSHGQYQRNLALIGGDLFRMLHEGIKNSYQKKRGPSAHTITQLHRITQLRARGVSWAAIDRNLGLRPGTARQIWRDAKRRRWV